MKRSEIFSSYEPSFNGALELMRAALDDVAPKYIMENIIVGDRATQLQVERCFAYELYHQLRNRIDQRGFKDSKGNDIEVNGECTKSCRGIKFPDLVIHGGQSNFNPKLQLLICEVKRNINPLKPNKTRIRADLKKLGNYIVNLHCESGDIGFQGGCFIMTNVGKQVLFDTVKEILRKRSIDIQGDEKIVSIEEISSRIAIFSYLPPNSLVGDNSTIDMFLLSEVYDSMNS